MYWTGDHVDNYGYLEGTSQLPFRVGFLISFRRRRNLFRNFYINEED